MSYNKYHAIKTGKSASKKEAARKRELELMERAGRIESLRCQVPFELIPAQYEPDIIGKRGGKKRGRCIERSAVYVADFVYFQAGKQIVEDAKGYKGGEAYKLFVLKRKMMLWRYGIRIREV